MVTWKGLAWSFYFYALGLVLVSCRNEDLLQKFSDRINGRRAFAASYFRGIHRGGFSHPDLPQEDTDESELSDDGVEVVFLDDDPEDIDGLMENTELDFSDEGADESFLERNLDQDLMESASWSSSDQFSTEDFDPEDALDSDDPEDLFNDTVDVTKNEDFDEVLPEATSGISYSQEATAGAPKKKRTKHKSKHHKAKKRREKSKKRKIESKASLSKDDSEDDSVSKEKVSLIKLHRDRSLLKTKAASIMKISVVLKAIFLLYFGYLAMLIILPKLFTAAVVFSEKLGEVTIDQRGLQVLAVVVSVLFKFFEGYKKSPRHTKAKPAAPVPKQQHFIFEPMNNRYEVDLKALQQAEEQSGTKTKKSPASKRNIQGIKSPKSEKPKSRSLFKSLKNGTWKMSFSRNSTQPVNSNESSPAKGRVFVLQWPDASINLRTPKSMCEEAQINFLRNSITFLLEAANSTDGDEVVLLLESPGGSVANFGFCASQLQRLRDAQVTLTVCVDKVAASGGYLMACMGSRILAAPYAMVGSIGVMTPAVVNYQKALEKHGIDSYEFAAGVKKVPISSVGKVTDDKVRHMQEQLETVHRAFKNTVYQARPSVHVDDVGTGEVWLAVDALKNNLIDEILTSDEYLAQRSKETAVYLIKHFQSPATGGLFRMLSPSGPQFATTLKKATESMVHKFLKILVREINDRFISEIHGDSTLAAELYQMLFKFSYGK